MRRVRPWKAEREQGHCERVEKLDPECAQESEEAERGQCCQYNGRGEVVARVEPEERVREREKEREDRPAGDAVPPFEDTRSPPPLEVIRGSITPVFLVESSVSHVWCQEEEAQADQRHACDEDLRASMKGPSHASCSRRGRRTASRQG
jgi:hypothetical protein